MSTHAAPARPSAVSRALARDRLGMPAVLAFILAGVAPMTVAAGVIPTAYAITGLTGIPAAFLVVAVVLALFATGYVAMTRQIRNAGAFYAFIARGAGPGHRGRRRADGPGRLQLLPGRPVRGARPGRRQAEAAAHLGVHCAVVGVGAGRLGGGHRAGPGPGRDHRPGPGRADRRRDRRHRGRDRLRAGLPGRRAPELRDAVPVGPDLVRVRRHRGAGGDRRCSAFVGFEQAPVLAEEARNPRRTIPAATYTALAAIGVRVRRRGLGDGRPRRPGARGRRRGGARARAAVRPGQRRAWRRRPSGCS